MNPESFVSCRESLATHGRSFHLASKLLDGRVADRVAALYAFCRRLDDAIDVAPPGGAAIGLASARADVAAAYCRATASDPVVEAFRLTAREARIPMEYPEELLAGFAMDASDTRYADLDSLLLYCYRVAGVVGAMMCHVLGVRERVALRHAAHLGIAMQLTNICRDVLEDWQRGRLYLPADLLAGAGAPSLASELGGPFPPSARGAVTRVVGRLLDEADRYYASADRGLEYLSFRSALGIRAARLLYAAIGDRLRRRGSDPLAGRAVVPPVRKLALLLRAAAAATFAAISRPRVRFRAVALDGALRYPADVVPL